MDDQWLDWARRLQAIGSTGAFFGEGAYDRERYDEITSIAHAMLAALGSVPIERIEGLVPDYATGYATPRIDVRGAVFRDQRILLVREKVDGLWTLPGGYADVGLSAAENAVKEVWEEAGIQTRATHLIQAGHKAKHDYSPDFRDFYKFFFLCEQVDDAEPHVGPETSDVGWYSRDRLPELSRGRVIERDIEMAFEFHANPGVAAFD